MKTIKMVFWAVVDRSGRSPEVLHTTLATTRAAALARLELFVRARVDEKDFLIERVTLTFNADDPRVVAGQSASQQEEG